MRPRALAVFAVLMTLFAFGCSSTNSSSAPKPTGKQANDIGLNEGREIWMANCARCHGASGQGDVGPKLADGAVKDRFSDSADQVEFIKRGSGIMPSFDDRLSDDDINAVVRYTREVL